MAVTKETFAADKGEAPKLYYSSFHYIYLHWCTCKLL